MADFLQGCNSGELQTDAKSFQDVWCKRCRRRECDLAQWRGDQFSKRVAEQPDRIFGATQADLNIPKFAQIAALDFPNLLAKAMRLEISSRKNDWTIPEIPITDGQNITADEATTQHVDAALRQLGRGRDIDVAPLEPDFEKATEAPEAPLVLSTPQPLPQPPQPVAKPVAKPVAPLAQARVRSSNVEQPTERMVDGEPVPRQQEEPVSDPWAPKLPETAIKAKPGAKIRFGLTGVKITDE